MDGRQSDREQNATAHTFDTFDTPDWHLHEWMCEEVWLFHCPEDRMHFQSEVKGAIQCKMRF